MYVCAHDAFRIIGCYTLACANRFLSLSLARYTLTRAYRFGLRPLYTRAQLSLWLTATLHSRAPTALTYGRFTLARACHFCLSLPRCSRGKPARGHVDQTQPRKLSPFAIVPVLICRQAPIACHVLIPRSASTSRYRYIQPKTLVRTRSVDRNNIP